MRFFYFVYNTLVNRRTASCLFLDINEEVAVAKISGNIFAGTGTIYTGTTAELNNNIIEESISALDFVDESNYNYQLSLNSIAIDIADTLAPVNGHSLRPEFVYVHPLSFLNRTNLDNRLDAGAYEWEGTVSSSHDYPQKKYLDLS